jgi:hypothetical protein
MTVVAPSKDLDNPWGWATSLFDEVVVPIEIRIGWKLSERRRKWFLHDLNLFRDRPQTVFNPGVASDGKVERRTSVLAHAAEYARHASRGVAVLYNAQLRMYVDEWLDTGVRGRVEDPSTRDLTKAPRACWAVQEFAGEQRTWLIPHKDGLHLSLEPGSVDDLARANRIFSLFLLDDWRFKLAKCRRPACSCYFELNHRNRVYKRGTVCPGCTRIRSLESALRGTYKARKQAGRELYGLVDKRFGSRIANRPGWNRDAKLRREIIAFLNEQIGKSEGLRSVYPRGITGKWLSWDKNRRGIQSATSHRSAKS